MDAELTVREMVSLFARFYARPRDVTETIEQVGPQTDLHQTRALIGVLKLFAPSSNHDQFADWPP